jgi:hypothetical protein
MVPAYTSLLAGDDCEYAGEFLKLTNHRTFTCGSFAPELAQLRIAHPPGLTANWRRYSGGFRAGRFLGPKQRHGAMVLSAGHD